MTEQKEVFIEDVIGYLQAVREKPSYFFRGVSQKDYKLIPSITRPPTKLNLNALESDFLEKFKERIIAYYNPVPASDWEILMIGQHHGMQTRLLDWTTNPLVALFFSCEKDFSVDGRVYRIRGLRF